MIGTRFGQQQSICDSRKTGDVGDDTPVKARKAAAMQTFIGRF